MHNTNVRPAIPVTVDTDNWRQNKQIFDIYNLYRIVLGIILLFSFYLRDSSTTLGIVNQTLFVQLCVFYFMLNVMSLLPHLLRLSKKMENHFFVAILIVDILTLVMISYTCGGVSSGMAHLLIVPVATSSIIFNTRLSVFFAAIGSIGAIDSEGYLSLTFLQSGNYFIQVGLLGLTLFATSLSLQYLGNRIRVKEAINKIQAANIESLREINQQIIQRMQPGIVVAEQNGRLLNYNNSAKKLLNFNDAEGSNPTLPLPLFNQMETWKKNNSIRPKPL